MATSTWGGNVRRFLIALGIGLALFVPMTAAAAQTATPEDCIARAQRAGRDMTFGPPGCNYRDGKFTGFTDAQNDGSGVPGFFVTFIIFAVLWSLVPFAIALVMASNRGESVGGAVLLTLVLGWFGLLIVYSGQKKVAGAVDRILEPSAPPPAAATPTTQQPAAPARSVAERLRELEALRDDGLVTDDEYSDRRGAILAEV